MLDPRQDSKLINSEPAQLFERLRSSDGTGVYPAGYLATIVERIDRMQSRFSRALPTPEDMIDDGWKAASFKFEPVEEYDPDQVERKDDAKKQLIADLESCGDGYVNEYSICAPMGLVEMNLSTNMLYVSGKTDSLIQDMLHSSVANDEDPDDGYTFREQIEEGQYREAARITEGRYEKNVRLIPTERTLRCSIAGDPRYGHDVRVCLGTYAFCASLDEETERSVMIRHEGEFERRIPTRGDIELVKEVCERLLGWAESQ